MHSEYVTDSTRRIKIKTLKENRHKITYHRGTDHYKYLKIDLFGALRALFKARGMVTKIPHDFETIKRKIIDSGLDIKAIRDRFTEKVGYVTRGMLFKCAKMTRKEAIKELGTSFYKIQNMYDTRGIPFPWAERTCKKLPNNHIITSVVNRG